MKDYGQQLNDWFAKFEHQMETAVPNIVAETATEFFQDKFKTEEWDGQPWKPLGAKYAGKKTRGKGTILTRTGKMRNSIRPSEVNANKVVISAGSAQVPYAKAHNEGMRIRGISYVKPYTHPNLLGKGRRQVQGHTRKYDWRMPQRQFMGGSKFLNEAIITRLSKAFNNR